MASGSVTAYSLPSGEVKASRPRTASDNVS